MSKERFFMAYGKEEHFLPEKYEDLVWRSGQGPMLVKEMSYDHIRRSILWLKTHIRYSDQFSTRWIAIFETVLTRRNNRARDESVGRPAVLPDFL